MRNSNRPKNKAQYRGIGLVSLRCALRSKYFGLALGFAGVLGVFLPSAVVAQPSNATEIWLQPNSKYDAKGLMQLSGNQAWLKTGSDFWQFFSETNNSNPILTHIKVIKLSPGFVIDASLTELRAVYGWLRNNNIKLAVGIEMLTPLPNGCGRGVESFSPIVNGYLYKLKRSGVGVSYFVMDEPLFFGSEVKAPRACKASFEQTAKNILNSAKEIETLFPSAQIGEIEPIPQTTNLASWLNVYHQVMGKYPAVFFADVSWKRASDEQLAAWSKITRQHHIKFGVIYNAAEMKTSEKWANLVEDNIKRIELCPKIKVDIALFQSWIPQPSHLLPVSRSGTMSNVIERYLQQK